MIYLLTLVEQSQINLLASWRLQLVHRLWHAREIGIPN